MDNGASVPSNKVIITKGYKKVEKIQMLMYQMMSSANVWIWLEKLVDKIFCPWWYSKSHYQVSYEPSNDDPVNLMCVKSFRQAKLGNTLSMHTYGLAVRKIQIKLMMCG